MPLAAPSLLPLGLLERGFDRLTVVEWWRRTRGSEAVLERVIRPVCRGLQFTDADDFSAYNFLTWLHHVARGLPQNLAGGYLGPRDETIFRPFGRYLAGRGATLRTGAKLARVRFDHVDFTHRRRVRAFVLDDGEEVTADAFVAALPVWELVPLLPEAFFEEPFFRGLRDLPVAPAISVQLWFAEPVVDTPHFTLVGRTRAPVYQEQSTNAYPDGRGSRLSVIVSPADELLARPDEEITALALSSLARVQPRIRPELVVKSVVLKHARHLLRPLPGVMTRRPGQVTPVPNLFFAGDWTQQPFFGSQEGAVRSGKACGEKLLEICGPVFRGTGHDEARPGV